GRRPIPGLKSSEIENLIAYQIGALQAIATAAGHKVTHVKAHGALSNVACEDDMTARAIANAIKAVDPNLIFVVLANSKLVTAGEAANLPMVHEVFADRAYEDNGSLVSRKKPGAVLHDAKEIADRVVRMVQDGAVVSVTGKVIKMRTDTVCIHGDTPGAVEIGRGDTGLCTHFFNKCGASSANQRRGHAVQQCQGIRRQGHIVVRTNQCVGSRQPDRNNFPDADSGRSKRDHHDRRWRRPHADA